MIALALALQIATFSYCDEVPNKKASTSIGSPSNGRVDGAWKFEDTEFARVMPARHKQRCLSWGTKRLVLAVQRAAKKVGAEHPLGIGNIGRAKGGPIRDFSHSHQAGRDMDIAFYVKGRASEDLEKAGEDFDVERNWQLVRALLEDSSIDVNWMFVSPEVRTKLLDEAKRTAAPRNVVAKAREVLHQPSDAPPHDDHLHLRIKCTAVETRGGCRD